MPDEISVYRLRIGLNYRRQMKVKGLDYLSTFELLIILSLLLLCYHIQLWLRLTGELSFLIGEKIDRGLASLRSAIRF